MNQGACFFIPVSSPTPTRIELIEAALAKVRTMDFPGAAELHQALRGELINDQINELKAQIDELKQRIDILRASV